MPTFQIPLRGPAGEPVDLARTLNSHGFSELAPTRVDTAGGTLDLTLRVGGARPRRVRIGAGSAGRVAVEVAGRAPGARTIADLEEGVRHVLRLDQDLSGFYAVAREDPELAWATRGAGRMLRSPTVFEDVVKTVCTTNCTWSATVRMVNAIVGELGTPAVGGDGPLANAFPEPSTMAGAPETFFRDVARAGYRGAYLIDLADRVASGAVDLEAMARATSTELDDDELDARLRELPGVGPYASAHIMMTMGRNSRLILDSWTRPTYARLRGRRQIPDATIARRFRRYGEQAGLAFWLFVTRDWIETADDGVATPG
jgi:3-methyladenine DNA glycosylase/8-oxoguanine DNA glycosylase